MKKALLLLVCILCCLILVACGRNENNNPADTNTLNIDSIIDYFNEKTEKLISSFNVEDTESIPKFAKGMSLKLVSGVAEELPSSIYYDDITVVLVGGQKVIRKSYPNGDVSIVSVDGTVINVSTSESQNNSVPDMSNINIDTDSLKDALTLKKEDFVSSEAGVYILSSEALTRIFSAFGEDVGKMTLTLDLKGLNTDGKAAFTLDIENLSDAISLKLDFSDYDFENGTGMVPFELTSNSEIGISAKGSIGGDQNSLEVSLEILTGESTISANIKSKFGELPSLELNIEAKRNNSEDVISFALTYAAFDKSSGKGTLTFYSKEDGEEIKINADMALTFTEKLLKSLMLDFNVEFADFELSGSMAIEPEKTKVVGSTPISATVTLISEGEQNKFKVDIVTSDYSEEKLSYLIKVWDESKDKNKTSFEYSFNCPAEMPALSDSEKEYLSRSDSIYGNYDNITNTSMTLNDAAIKWISSLPSISNIPQNYYTVRDGIYYFTSLTTNGNQIYVTTSAIIDYENYDLTSAKYVNNIWAFQRPLVYEYAYRVLAKYQSGLDPRFSNPYSAKKTIYVSDYIPEIDKYLAVATDGSLSYVIMGQNYVGDAENGLYIHSLSEAVVHDFEIQCRDDCKVVMICRECGAECVSHDPLHDSGSKTEIPTDGCQTEFLICKHCDKMILNQKYTSGYEVQIVMRPWHPLESDFGPISNEVVNKLLEGPVSEKDLCIEAINVTFFEDTTHLPEIVIPQVKEATGYNIVAIKCGFVGLRALYDVKLILPDGIRYIMPQAFSRNPFSEIIMPDSVIFIGRGAFEYMSLNSLTIGKNVIEFSGALYGIRTLKKLTYEVAIEEFRVGNLVDTDIVFAPGTVIKKYYGSSNLNQKTLIIPEGVEYVGEFMNNPYIETVILPSTLKEIGERAFYRCSNLTEVIYSGNSIEIIGNEAFSYCNKLKSFRRENEPSGTIHIPESVKTLGSNVFNMCSSIEKVIINAGIDNISIGTFSRCVQLCEVALPEGVKEIGNSAFSNCIKLNVINFPSALEKVGERAFSGCVLLGDSVFKFGGHLRTIEDRAFEGCTGLKNITVPESVTELGSNAFSGCSFDSIIFCGETNFNGYSGISANKIVYLGNIKGEIIFGNVTEIHTLDLPAVSTTTYMVLGDNITDIYFAGSEETWRNAHYSTKKTTNVHCNYVFAE